MLGPERFASFETPNVIDPGDDAPIQPPRRRPAEPSSQQTSGQSTAGAPPPRSSARAPGLGRTQKIDLHNHHGDNNHNYQQARHSSKRLINSIEDLDLMETAQQQPSSESGDHRGEPSIDEARNYASALLQDANRRTSNRELMIGGGDDDELTTNIPAGLMSPLSSSYHDGSTTKKAMVRNQVWPLIFKVSGVLLILVLAILVVTRMS